MNWIGIFAELCDFGITLSASSPVPVSTTMAPSITDLDSDVCAIANQHVDAIVNRQYVNLPIVGVDVRNFSGNRWSGNRSDQGLLRAATKIRIFYLGREFRIQVAGPPNSPTSGN